MLFIRVPVNIRQYKHVDKTALFFTIIIILRPYKRSGLGLWNEFQLSIVQR